MKRLTAASFAFLIAVSFIGCGGGSARSKLIGKWEFDMDAMKPAIKAEMEKQAAGNPLASIMKDKMDEMIDSFKGSAEFKDDGTVEFSMSMGPKTKTTKGTWKVVESSGKKLTIETTEEGEEPEKITLTFVDDDTLELIPPKSSEMPKGFEKLTLKRVK